MVCVHGEPNRKNALLLRYIASNACCFLPPGFARLNSENRDLLGVIGVDVRLEQLQENVQNINFLETGYSILTTAGDDGLVLAAPTRVWDRDEAESPTTVCFVFCRYAALLCSARVFLRTTSAKNKYHVEYQ